MAVSSTTPLPHNGLRKEVGTQLHLGGGPHGCCPGLRGCWWWWPTRLCVWGGAARGATPCHLSGHACAPDYLNASQSSQKGSNINGDDHRASMCQTRSLEGPLGTESQTWQSVSVTCVNPMKLGTLTKIPSVCVQNQAQGRHTIAPSPSKIYGAKILQVLMALLFELSSTRFSLEKIGSKKIVS